MYTQDDLFNVRLVNKPLASAAAPPLFHTLPFWIGIKSLEGITGVAEHPELSKYVQRIICSPVRFIEYKDKSSHEKIIHEWFDEFFDDDAQSGAPATLAYGRYMSAYKNYIDAQTYLAERSLDVGLLAVALSKFSNLDSVIVDWLDDHIGSTEIIHAFGIFKAELLLSFDCVYFLPILFRALFLSNSKIQHLQLGTSDQLMHPDVRDLSHVIFRKPALSRSTTPQLPIVSHAKRITAEALLIAVPQSITLINLQTLRIGELHVADDRPVKLEMFELAIHRLIGSSPGLEFIELEPIEGSLSSNLLRPDLKKMIPMDRRLHWLRKLHTRGIDVTQSVLLDFLRDHALTLEDVEFWDMSLTGGDWASAIAHMREIKFSRLNHFTVCCSDDEVGEISVEDYILHVTDQNPILEERMILSREGMAAL